jgi:hypothetical protein
VLAKHQSRFSSGVHPAILGRLARAIRDIYVHVLAEIGSVIQDDIRLRDGG